MVASCAAAHGRELAFAERVAAQKSIARVYYAHQIGAPKSFEDTFPRALLEYQVRRYLKQSAALEQFWHTPITANMLERELHRMIQATRSPNRLRELFVALDDDPLLILECLARPALADRLTGDFYAFDPRFHSGPLQEARALRAKLIGGTLDPRHDDRARIEVDRTATREATASLALAEERSSFRIRVPLEEQDEGLRVAEYRVAKRPFDRWWQEVSPGLDELAVETVASPGALIPDTLEALGDPCVDNDVWDNGSLDDALAPRASHTAVWTGTHMLVWGGVAGGYLDTGLRYDPAIDTWTMISTENAPSPRNLHTAVWTGSLMVVWGGRNAEVLNTGGRYDPITNSWTPTSDVGAPAPTHVHNAVWTGSRMIVHNGRNVMNWSGIYDPEEDTWQPISVSGSPSWRTDNTAVWSGSHLLVWGGNDGTSDGWLNTGGRYDPTTDTWAPMSTEGAPDSRQGHSAVWTGTHMVVWGGSNGTGFGLRSGGRYDPAADIWTAVSVEDTPEIPGWHTATWTGNRVLIWNGTTGGLYDPATDGWTPMSADGAPLPRQGYTAVWTGSHAVIWGGQGIDFDNQGPENGLVNSGGRYDVANDSWTPTTIGGPPAARNLHSAVWTGTHMLVWGGRGGAVHDTGARYDPAIDTWASISVGDAPPARAYHSAIWTGSHMVVWGGIGDENQFLSGGGRYDPITDNWMSTSLVGAPQTRARYTAVWTGTHMLVWGGFEGGRYDPLADTWQPISSVNAPSVRQQHTAVWTGSHMVAWGGNTTSQTGLDTGGRYDPSTDTWAATSTVDAPSGRYLHTAVWTGTHMLVWGGLGGGDTGGKYDDSTDTWQAISTLDAPDRLYHTAVWTGSDMLIWGGYDSETFEWGDVGGRYQPATDRWTPMSTAGSPTPRFDHTALWTGSRMLVWGGLADNGNAQSGGGMYVPFHLPDDDGDGYDECAADCNDANAAIFPGAPELCDGLDNDCDFAIDEQPEMPQEVANLIFSSGDTLWWHSGSQGLGATTDVVRGTLDGLPVGSGSAEICVVSEPGDTTVDDATPASGTGFWYLVRARNACATGSYGEQSDGTERVTAVCP